VRYGTKPYLQPSSPKPSIGSSPEPAWSSFRLTSKLVDCSSLTLILTNHLRRELIQAQSIIRGRDSRELATAFRNPKHSLSNLVASPSVHARAALPNLKPRPPTVSGTGPGSPPSSPSSPSSAASQLMVSGPVPCRHVSPPPLIRTNSGKGIKGGTASGGVPRSKSTGPRAVTPPLREVHGHS